MKTKHWALIVFIILGAVKLPLEHGASRTLLASNVLHPPPSLSLRENLGQMSFAAALGGLRSFVACITYLQAYTAHEQADWTRVDNLMTITTRLQPRYAPYWDSAAAFMAYDAAHYYNYNRDRPSLYRQQLYQQHIERGIAILKEGLQHLPDSARLHENLAYLYARRMQTKKQPTPGEAWIAPEHKLAGESFLRAYQCGGLPVMERLAAYEFAELPNDPDAWSRAYDILHRWYQKNVRPPGVIDTLKALEKKLNTPVFMRIP